MIIGSLLATAAVAETRVALIVGNASYARPEFRLANPANDATAMQRALQAAGFQTIVRVNASRIELYRAVEEFSQKIGRDPRAVGLFYYAGHGVQVDGTNYLIPVDAQVESVGDLEANGFEVGRVLRAMESAQNDMNIVILDACRNNPLPKTRGITRGLARMNAPSGTYIAYAAAPGQTAQDGAQGANGVFTGELVKAMAEPGLPLEQVFKRVIAAVKAETRGSQQPWSEASIQGDFYFHEKPSAAVLSRPAEPAQIELTYWESIRDSRNAADFRAYLAKYPRGNFAGLAANRLTSLSAASPRTQLPPVRAEPPQASPAQQATPDNSRQKTLDPRCRAIMARAQTGDSLDEEERDYLSRNCR